METAARGRDVGFIQVSAAQASPVDQVVRNILKAKAAVGANEGIFAATKTAFIVSVGGHALNSIWTTGHTRWDQLHALAHLLFQT